MGNRIVKLIYPMKKVFTASFNVPTKKGMSVYDTVNSLDDEFSRLGLFQGIGERVLLIDKVQNSIDRHSVLKITRKKMYDVLSRDDNFRIEEPSRFSAGSVINIHDEPGIRSICGMKQMIRILEGGYELLSQNGMHNIKLVRTKNNELLLFDGHHTMLAYMFVGRKYLDEIPHLIVEDEETGYVKDKEIRVFFGEHSARLKDENWRKYVINWQAPEERQLQKRVQNNMGELLDSLKLTRHLFKG